MAAPRTLYACQSCGYQSTKWLGRCPECGTWSSMVEELRETPKRGAPAGERAANSPVALSEIDQEHVLRTPSGIPALDRVLGGGVVAGGTVLLAGEPGIGKSTLLLQLAARLAGLDRTVLYASAEESPRQLRLRAERLGCASSDVLVVGETRLEAVLEAARAVTGGVPAALLVDSIQAIASDELESPPGSIGQVRHCANRLVDFAKRSESTLFLVGHVTKEGTIAGPKSLEHLVDTVLNFEGERESDYRILRAAKNRFGPTGEIAMFEMRESGLEPVSDPSQVLLARRRRGAPGSAVLPTLSGARPLLVETQALVSPTNFPSPRRMSVGLDGNRVILLVAVLERFAKLGLADRDVFLNVVGGLALKEPAADLAVAAALISAYRGVALPPDAVFFGEIGLLGEVRPVSQAEARLREAAAHGFKQAYLPRVEALAKRVDMQLIPISTLEELAEQLPG
ncbi:MAG: DNA repair protein RadA [Thermoanaerobaculia bacterium]